VIATKGTLESNGLNPGTGSTAGTATDLGYTWIGNNANGNPPTGLPSPGVSGTQWKAGAGAAESGLVNESVKTGDTQMVELSGGTLENGNDNGANWTR